METGCRLLNRHEFCRKYIKTNYIYPTIQIKATDLRFQSHFGYKSNRTRILSVCDFCTNLDNLKVNNFAHPPPMRHRIYRSKSRSFFHRSKPIDLIYMWINFAKAIRRQNAHFRFAELAMLRWRMLTFRWNISPWKPMWEICHRRDARINIVVTFADW